MAGRDRDNGSGGCGVSSDKQKSAAGRGGRAGTTVPLQKHVHSTGLKVAAQKCALFYVCPSDKEVRTQTSHTLECCQLPHVLSM